MYSTIRTNSKKARHEWLTRVAILTVLALGLVLLVACAPAFGMGQQAEPTAPPDDAVQLPDETQTYIDLSRAALAAQLGIAEEAIELDSVIEATSAGDPVIIKLRFEGHVYEFHGRDGEAVLVSGDGAAPGRLLFQPAAIGEVQVQIDETAAAPISVIVRGNLSGDCAEIHEGTANMLDAHTFAVWVTERRPAGEPCREIARPYETTVSLGVQAWDLPAGDYSVVVNEQTTETFALDLPDGSATAATRLPHVTVELDERVADAIDGRELVAVPVDQNTPYFAIYPQRVEFEFSGYAHGASMHLPKIYVYPVEDLVELNEAAQAPVARLQQLLQKKPDLSQENTLPFLPFFNAQSVFHARGEYLSFEGGEGIRYVTQFGQAAGPVNNRELLYTFQGLTGDGAYYVSAVFPVAQQDLPADVASAEAGFPDGFENYIEDVKRLLDKADATSFTPSIDVLDSIVRTINVTPQ